MKENQQHPRITSPAFSETDTRTVEGMRTEARKNPFCSRSQDTAPVGYKKDVCAKHVL